MNLLGLFLALLLEEENIARCFPREATGYFLLVRNLQKN